MLSRSCLTNRHVSNNGPCGTGRWICYSRLARPLDELSRSGSCWINGLVRWRSFSPHHFCSSVCYTGSVLSLLFLCSNPRLSNHIWRRLIFRKGRQISLRFLLGLFLGVVLVALSTGSIGEGHDTMVPLGFAASLFGLLASMISFFVMLAVSVVLLGVISLRRTAELGSQ